MENVLGYNIPIIKNVTLLEMPSLPGKASFKAIQYPSYSTFSLEEELRLKANRTLPIRIVNGSDDKKDFYVRGKGITRYISTY